MVIYAYLLINFCLQQNWLIYNVNYSISIYPAQKKDPSLLSFSFFPHQA